MDNVGITGTYTMCSICHTHCIKCEYRNNWLCDLCDIEGEYICEDIEFISRCDKCRTEYLSKS